MTQNSPIGLETETAKRPGRWKHVSDERNNVYVPRNAPIEVPGTRNRESVFEEEEVLGADEKPAVSIEGETVGDSNKKQSGDVDGTISGGNVDSKCVEVARLAAESQHSTCNNARWRRNDLPEPPESLFP